MDTSETYIKMCDCEEMQRDAPDTYGSIFWCTSHNKEIGLDYDCQSACEDNLYGLESEECKWIWLPRQDQLQEMYAQYKEWDITGGVALNFALWEWVNNYDGGAPIYTSKHWEVWSMEQLWLGFVKRERYQESWNGETWIKE
jgi:hypothetical protein